MESKVLSKVRNPFLNREEIIMEIKGVSAPSIESVKEATGKPKELIVVKKVYSNFGNQTFKADLVIYDSVESKDRIEVVPRKIRKKVEEEKKAAKAAEASAKPEEKK